MKTPKKPKSQKAVKPAPKPRKKDSPILYRQYRQIPPKPVVSLAFQGIPTHFWVVTQPKATSTEADCVFQTDFVRLYQQFLGGLEISEVRGLFEKPAPAQTYFADLLKEAKTQRDQVDQALTKLTQNGNNLQDEVTNILKKVEKTGGKTAVNLFLRMALVNYAAESSGNENPDPRIEELAEAIKTPCFQQ